MLDSGWIQLMGSILGTRGEGWGCTGKGESWDSILKFLFCLVLKYFLSVHKYAKIPQIHTVVGLERGVWLWSCIGRRGQEGERLGHRGESRAFSNGVKEFPNMPSSLTSFLFL